MKLYLNKSTTDAALLSKMRAADVHYPTLYDYNIDEIEDDCVLLIDIHDLVSACINLPNFLIKFNSFKNKKLIIFYHYKSIKDINFVNAIKKHLPALSIDDKSVYVILQTAPDIAHLSKEFPNWNYLEYDKWVDEYHGQMVAKYFHHMPFPRPNNITKNIPYNTFSLCIRRFAEERFKFMCELVHNDLLRHFNFTFTNGVGDCCTESFPISEIKKMVDQEKYAESIDKINTFIEGIPYASDDAPQYDPYPQTVDHMIKKSGIAVVYETSIDGLGLEMFSEKTYKAMFCQKPFILVCRPGALAFLRDNGYKTFHPLINESYDEIEDHDERMLAVVKEINRIANMSHEFRVNLMRDAGAIAEYNFNILMSKMFKLFPYELTMRGLGLYD